MTTSPVARPTLRRAGRWYWVDTRGRPMQMPHPGANALLLEPEDDEPLHVALGFSERELVRRVEG